MPRRAATPSLPRFSPPEACRCPLPGRPLWDGRRDADRVFLAGMYVPLPQIGMTPAEVTPLRQAVVLGGGVIVAVDLNRDRRGLLLVKQAEAAPKRGKA